MDSYEDYPRGTSATNLVNRKFVKALDELVLIWLESDPTSIQSSGNGAYVFLEEQMEWRKDHFKGTVKPVVGRTDSYVVKSGVQSETRLSLPDWIGALRFEEWCWECGI